MTVAELIAKLQTMPQDLPVRVQLDYLNLTEESYGAHDILEVYVPYSHAPCYLGVLYYESICGKCGKERQQQERGCG